MLRRISDAGVAARTLGFTARDVWEVSTEWTRHLPADTSELLPEGCTWTRLRPRPQGKLVSQPMPLRDTRPRCPAALRVLLCLRACMGPNGWGHVLRRFSRYAMLLLVW